MEGPPAPHLGILRRVGHIDLWDDRQIGSGADWYDEIKGAMEKAAVAVCLAQAREMIAEMGYHRRDGEGAELEEALGKE